MEYHFLLKFVDENLIENHYRARKLLSHLESNIPHDIEGEYGNFTEGEVENSTFLYGTYDPCDLERNLGPLENNSFPDEGSYECYPTVLTFFATYYLPFIICLGIVGNFLSCVVFLTTHLKMRSSSYYLAALASADFGFLTILSLVYLSNNLTLDFFNTEGWCQTLVYISSVCSSLSVWLIVAFTVERFIAIQYPLQRPQMCTVSRAKITVVILTFLAFLSHSYCFFTAGMVRVDDCSPEQCNMLEEYRSPMKIINLIDTVVSLIGPVVLIVSMNAMIARNLLLFRKKFQIDSLDECLYSSTELNQTVTTQSGYSNRHNRYNSNQSHQSSKSTSSRTSRKTKTTCVQLPRCIHIKSSGSNLISAKNQQSITKMLLLISSVFIVLNLPSYVVRMYVFLVYYLFGRDTPVWLYCLQQFVMLLYYTNFSINFLLYAMYGITFRRCLKQLIRKNIKNLHWRRPCAPQRSLSDGQQLNEMRRD